MMTALPQYSDSELQNFGSEIQDSATYNSVSERDYPVQRRRLLEALAYIKKNLEDNWNGQDSKKPSVQAISMAEHFVSYLFLTKEHADFIEPDGDGGILLKWKKPDLYIILTIDGTAMHMSYEKINEDSVFIDDVPFFDPKNEILPKDILNYIPVRRVNA